MRDCMGGHSRVALWLMFAGPKGSARLCAADRWGSQTEEAKIGARTGQSETVVTRTCCQKRSNDEVTKLDVTMGSVGWPPTRPSVRARQEESQADDAPDAPGQHRFGDNGGEHA